MMVDVTEQKLQLSTYAEAVLRQNGIKSCRTRWRAADVLSIEVDPIRQAKAESLVPVIQQRAGQGVQVVIDPIGANPASTTR